MKEGDQLENFIHQNRNAFDDKEPSAQVWKNIAPTLRTERKIIGWNAVGLWRAAAIFFMALSVYLFIQAGKQKQESTLALKEFSDVEQFYIHEISEKIEMIDGFEHQEGLNGFTQDFKQLEAMYTVLKEEMKSRPSQKVKDALVLNLLVRIDLLNQQLHRLEKAYPAARKKQSSSI